MYKIIGRERLAEKRLGKYLVEFTHPWPPGIDHLYLVSSFTSFFPGRVELTREGDRGRVIVSLWEGTYPYRFASTCGYSTIDAENPRKANLRLWPDSEGIEEYSIAEVGLQEYRSAQNGGALPWELVVHDERDPAFISYFLGYTVTRIKAPRGLLERVYIEGVNGKINEMSRFHSNDYVDYFQGVIPGKITAYRFILESSGEKIYYGKNGLGDEEYITPGRVTSIESAEWYYGCNYYLIFPDSFTRRPLPHENNRPKIKLGGKLKDITESLDYLHSLGIEAIYLTPIYEAKSYHRYDVINHKSIDPDLGSWEEWAELVEKAREKGIHLVVDIVAHHASPCSAEFTDALLNPESPRRKWFRFHSSASSEDEKALKMFVKEGCKEFPAHLRGKRPFYETFFCNWGMAKLNYSNDEVVERLKDIALFWLEKGASGIRIDVGHAIPDQALTQLYENIKKRKDAVVILEVSKGANFYPYGLTGDSAMNYDLRELLLDFLLYRRIRAPELVKGLKELYVNIPLFSANAMYNLLGSHDTPRIATLAERCNGECLEPLYVLLFSLPGSPAIYYGDEIGMQGGPDPDNRLPMVWDEQKWNRRLHCLIRRLALLRRETKPLRYGFFDADALSESAVAVYRWWGEEQVSLFLNTGEKILVELPGEHIDMWSGEHVETLKLGTNEWRLLYKKKVF
ncbi:MAG: alpha-amylase family glycosyl hydrolase [Infirmifilum sp.]